TPEDGGIDWRESTRAVHRLVRAVAPPYPGAFCYLDEVKIVVIEAQPFDTALFPSSIPAGAIVDVARSAGHFVVKTVDGSLLVTGFSGVSIEDIRVGQRLHGTDRALLIETLPSRYGETPRDQWEVR